MSTSEKKIPTKPQEEINKNKEVSYTQTLIIKESMRKALESYKKRARYKSKAEIYKAFSNDLEAELGYKLGEKQIENYFRPSPPAEGRPLAMPDDAFLFVWFARKMGISLDDLLAGGRISSISSASTSYEAVNAFVTENLKLTMELSDKVGSIELPELYGKEEKTK